MNVLHIVNSLEIGGLEKFVVDLTQKLQDVNHIVVSLNSKGEFFNKVRGKSLFINSPPRISLFSVYKLVKIVREHSIDLIHTHNQGPQFYGSIVGTITGNPVVHTKHGQNFNSSKRRLLLEKFSSFLTDCIVTVSIDAKEICLNDLNIPKQKVHTILNGVDTDVYRKYNRKNEETITKPYIIGTVGRLSHEKNHSYLIDTCLELRKKNVYFKCKIVGDGPLKDNLIEKCNKLGLSDFISFEGNKNNIPYFLNKFDLFVLPSLTEGISLTLLEAMSCELPVVATRVGGTPEVVVEGRTGFLVSVNDVDQLADAVLTCLKDPSRSLDMGHAARARVKANFSLERVATDYLKIYEKLVRK